MAKITKTQVWKSLNAAGQKLAQKLNRFGESRGSLSESREWYTLANRVIAMRINVKYATDAAEVFHRVHMKANATKGADAIARAASSLWGAAKTAADPSNPADWSMLYIKRAVQEMKS